MYEALATHSDFRGLSKRLPTTWHGSSAQYLLWQEKNRIKSLPMLNPWVARACNTKILSPFMTTVSSLWKSFKKKDWDYRPLIMCLSWLYQWSQSLWTPLATEKNTRLHFWEPQTYVRTFSYPLLPDTVVWETRKTWICVTPVPERMLQKN